MHIRPYIVEHQIQWYIGIVVYVGTTIAHRLLRVASSENLCYV